MRKETLKEKIQDGLNHFATEYQQECKKCSKKQCKVLRKCIVTVIVYRNDDIYDPLDIQLNEEEKPKVVMEIINHLEQLPIECRKTLFKKVITHKIMMLIQFFYKGMLKKYIEQYLEECEKKKMSINHYSDMLESINSNSLMNFSIL